MNNSVRKSSNHSCNNIGRMEVCSFQRSRSKRHVLFFETNHSQALQETQVSREFTRDIV